MKILYSKIQELIDVKLPEPRELGRLINTHAFEVEEIEPLENGDTLFDLAVLPDRAADCLSHFGVAMEVAAICGLSLAELPPVTFIESPEIDSVSVAIDSGSARRYMSRRIVGVTVGPSPVWLKTFLESLGQRSINNIVDATNYIMWIWGQPTHAFDAQKIIGSRLEFKEAKPEISVRFAKKGEQMTTLDHKEIELLETDVVIANTDTVLALGGVKGGLQSGISESTTEVILEVGNFYPNSVRKTARRLGLLTDAAKRFENNYSDMLTDKPMSFLTQLILDIAGGTAGPVTDIYSDPSYNPSYDISVSNVNKLLGTHYDQQSCIDRLRRKGFECIIEDADRIAVTAPCHRRDIDCWQALADEIARYDEYTAGSPWTMNSSQLSALSSHDSSGTKIARLQNALAHKLISVGFFETQTYSFAHSGDIRVAGSVAEDKSFLRSAIHPLFRESLDKNFRNRELMGVDTLQQFEIGTVWHEDEAVHLCLGIHASKQKGIREQLFSKLSDVLYECGLPRGDSSGLTEKTIHKCITYHDDYIIECNLSTVIDSITRIPTVTSLESTVSSLQSFVQWSPYPYITRDIAVWVPAETVPSELVDLYSALAGDLLIRPPRQFDQFTKDSRTSYAHRLVFQSMDKTLTDSEIEPIMAAITTQLQEKGYEVR